jgi:DNA-binding transcriptional MerR regulator
LTFEAGRRFSVAGMRLRIAEVAERTGVPATTLRYYEDIGLLAPAQRSGNGYRSYSERDVERLRFVTRAKQLDIGLDDLRELVRAWDGEDCAGVQGRMAEVVSARLRDAQDRLAELAELTGQLQSAVTRLAAPPRAGACDDGCACSTAHEVTRTPVPMTITGPPVVPPTPAAPQPAQIRADRGTAARAARAGRTGLIGGAGLFAACVLVCCLPLLAAAAAAIGLGALATGAWALGAGVLLVAAGTGVIVLRRRRRRQAHDGTGSCGCGGGCAC